MARYVQRITVSKDMQEIIDRAINWQEGDNIDWRFDYEYMILDMAEDDGGVADDCASCSYKGVNCKSQCEKEIEIYNPNLY